MTSKRSSSSPGGSAAAVQQPSSHQGWASLCGFAGLRGLLLLPPAPPPRRHKEAAYQSRNHYHTNRHRRSYGGCWDAAIATTRVGGGRAARRRGAIGGPAGCCCPFRRGASRGCAVGQGRLAAQAAHILIGAEEEVQAAGHRAAQGWVARVDDQAPQAGQVCPRGGDGAAQVVALQPAVGRWGRRKEEGDLGAWAAVHSAELGRLPAGGFNQAGQVGVRCIVAQVLAQRLRGPQPQHSTAQHSTARHGTAQDGTAQHSHFKAHKGSARGKAP